MPAPLVGAAALAAARIVAKKLATKAVKKAPIKKIAMTPKEAALKKKVAVKVGPKNSVKVVKPTNALSRATTNTTRSIVTNLAKSGDRAKEAAKTREKAIAASRADGTMAKPVKIKSGGDIKPAFSKKAKPMSYSQLKDMPNLVKIDSAKGNTVKKIAYRKRTSN
jgi:hypothetical protein